MNKKIASIALLLTVIAVGVAYASLTTTVHVPTSWIINHNVNISVTINGTLWTNGTSFDWGEVSLASSYSVDLTVENFGSLPCTVTVTAANLPVGYSLTWSSSGDTMPVGGSMTGDLTLVVPVDGANGDCDLYIIAVEG